MGQWQNLFKVDRPCVSRREGTDFRHTTSGVRTIDTCKAILRALFVKNLCDAVSFKVASLGGQVFVQQRGTFLPFSLKENVTRSKKHVREKKPYHASWFLSPFIKKSQDFGFIFFRFSKVSLHRVFICSSSLCDVWHGLPCREKRKRREQRVLVRGTISIRRGPKKEKLRRLTKSV